MKEINVAAASEQELGLKNEEISYCGLTAEELELARQQPNKAVISRPPLLGYASTVFLIINRVVGTGIFRTPTALAHGTRSVGCSLLFWAAGGVVAVSGSHVFAELGLTIPRLDIENEGKQFVPRNGGEKNYIEYFFDRPTFLATCIYGIPFVILGNMAGNSLIFADAILGANGAEVEDWAMRGLAIGVVTFACTLHAVWRRGGVYLNNFFGFVKTLILVSIFALGVAYACGAFGGDGATGKQNLSVHESFANAGTSSYGYAESFLAVVFAFGGFNQASYVLGEIEHSRKRFKPTTISTVAFVATLYILVNISYMLVVPSSEQLEPGSDTVARNFFRRICGAQNFLKIQNSIVAFSSLGNIIVQTFTATRVKQEIAKEGIFPLPRFSKFLSNNYSLTPRWLRSQRTEGSEDTPVGAFLMHWTFAVILIIISAPAKGESYRVLVSVYSFTIDAMFGFLVGLCLLIYRFRRGSEWSKISASTPWISVVTAAIFTVANLFPLIAVWIPPSAEDNALNARAPWFTAPTLGVSVVGFAFLYWIALYYVVPFFKGKTLEVDREYNFITDHGYWVMWHEVVSFKWKSV